MGGCCCVEKEKQIEINKKYDFNISDMHSITKNLDKIIYIEDEFNSEQTNAHDIGSSESEPENDKLKYIKYDKSIYIDSDE